MRLECDTALAPGLPLNTDTDILGKFLRVDQFAGRSVERFWPLRLIAGIGLTLFVAVGYGGDRPLGRELYERQCALCHGFEGEGSAEHFPRPLTGERSVTQLSRFIAKSMPPEMPGMYSGEEANRVAAYIYD